MPEKKRLNEMQGYYIKHLSNHIKTMILEKHPEYDDETFITADQLAEYRKEYIALLVNNEEDVFFSLKQKVVDSIQENRLISADTDTDYQNKLTFGQRAADSIAKFGGSWAFIIFFLIFMTTWISLNVVLLKKHPFDPFPFILLNLILSCIAALQAPIIMMSQNRQEDKDRHRSKSDFLVNLKAEVEVSLLHEKVDFLNKQWEDMVEIQNIQIDLLNEIHRHLEYLEKSSPKT